MNKLFLWESCSAFGLHRLQFMWLWLHIKCLWLPKCHPKDLLRPWVPFTGLIFSIQGKGFGNFSPGDNSNLSSSPLLDWIYIVPMKSGPLHLSRIAAFSLLPPGRVPSLEQRGQHHLTTYPPECKSIKVRQNGQNDCSYITFPPPI